MYEILDCVCDNCQEESQSLCWCDEERRGTDQPVCCHFSSREKFAADNSQPAAAVSADDQGETGAAAATGTQPVQRRYG